MLSLAEKIIFIFLVLVAVAAAIREFNRKFRLIVAGKKVNRFDRPWRRLGEMAARVMFQIPVYQQRPVTGFFHSMIFWGFFVFMLVTLNHVAEGFFHTWRLLGRGVVYRVVLAGANFFAGAIILAVVYFLVRRYVFKAPGLDRPSWPSLIVLFFILVLMVSFLYFEAFKMVSEPASKADFLAGVVYRHLLPAAAVASPAALLLWTKFFWWLHILFIMAFGVFIPYSKHLHLIAGPINIIFKHNGPKAEIPLVNLEEQEKFGTPTVLDLNRKDLLDLFSCAECGRCDTVCPALASGKTLSPKTLLHKLKEYLLTTGKGGELKKLFAEVISEEEVWACTTCAACMEVCPMFNEHIAKIMGMRQSAVLMESRFPEEFNVLYRGLENQGNPWGISADSRSDWAQDLAIPRLAECQSTDVLFWVGCAGSYDAHSQKIARAFVRVLKQAGIDFAILGNEEHCCGDPARRTGMEYLFQILARQNIEVLSRYRFRRIVTTCPHGLHVLKNEYPKFGGSYPVVHHTQLLLELLDSGRIRLAPATAAGAAGAATAFHDPCYLGRYNGIYDPPRELLRRLNGTRSRELKNTRRTSFCCGAGGGGMWKEEKVGRRISHLRVEEASRSGAGNLATACPFCSIMFRDAISETDRQEKLQTADVVQMVFDRLEK